MTSLHNRSRARRSAVALAAALAFLVSPLAAQEPAAIPATHTVKRGDTLWDIAKLYLNDPFLWPEIYRLNTDVVEDPHWIYPGEVLKLPGPGGAQVVSEDQVAPDQQQQQAVQQPTQPAGTTVFSIANKRRVLSASRFGGTANTFQHTAVRAGQFYAAPWIDKSSGPSAWGEIIRTANVPGEVRGVQRDRFTTEDYIFVTMPKGVVAAKGDRFLIYRMGEDFGNGTQMMIPTGIMQVAGVDGSDATLGIIVAFFGEVRLGQRIIPLEKFTMNPDARPAPLLLGTEGKIMWIPSNITVGDKQDYLVLDVGLKDGVKLGDLFTVYRPRTQLQLEDGSNVMVPEIRIGVVQIVKVTDFGATALVTDIRFPGITPGTPARLTARMP